MAKWEEKKVNLASAVALSGAMLVIGGIFGANWQNWFGALGPQLGLTSKVSEAEIDWTPLDEVYNKLAATYNGEIDDELIVEGAKKGLTAALGDKYTDYMTSSESGEFYSKLHGEAGYGVGMELGLRDGYVRVLRTLPDNPAAEAGILAGDILYKVNGEEVYQLSADEISKLITGDAGTAVAISVIRDGEEKEFNLQREEINNVSAYIDYDGNTAIITVKRFDEDTGQKVQKMAQEFGDKGVEKVILDLRGNSGGYVTAARDLLSLWIDNKDILIQKSIHQGNTTTKTNSGKAILENMETVVLVDGTTASASEIVAGGLQDYGKATVVGEKTYGKGVVQTLYTLSNGGTLKVTTAEWFTPNDRSINNTGITPDIEVGRTYDDINAMRDPQLDKAKEL